MSTHKSTTLICNPASAIRIIPSSIYSYSPSFLNLHKTPPPNSASATTSISFALHSSDAKLRGGSRRRTWNPLAQIDGSSLSSDNQTVSVASPTTTDADGERVVDSAADIVRNFYGGINCHDLDSVQDLIAENCVYEDLIFPQPFVGRKEILQFFKKFNDSISTDLQFVIDDLSTEDSLSVGVIWHLEWKGRPFPFSKGCSFYRLKVVNGKRQIVYGRDSVEPAIKPGETALAAIRSVTWLLQQFPQLVDRL